MGRGPLSREKKLERARKAALEALGITEEELPPIEQPVETSHDLMREAQSTLFYFHVEGKGFTDRVCKNCGELFAYCWNSDAIAYCSIICIKAALQKIGLDWDPSKPLTDRWRLGTMPSIVPPQALMLVKETLNQSRGEIQVNLPPDTVAESA